MVWAPSIHELVMFGGATTPADTPASPSKKTWLFQQVQPGVWDWRECTACATVMPKLISPGLAYDAYVDPLHISSDATAGQVIEFGGDSGGTKSNNTYRFDGTTWHLMTPGTSPIPLASPALAFHTVRNKVILFGGKCDSGTGCDQQHFYGLTWAWDGTAQPNPTWVQLSVGNPGNRTGNRMAYDPNLGSLSGLYLFGGLTGNGVVHDTWYLLGTGNWTQCSESGLCASHPGDRCCVGLAYDGRNAVLALFGGGACEGGCSTFYQDNWKFDATGWHCVTFCP